MLSTLRLHLVCPKSAFFGAHLRSRIHRPDTSLPGKQSRPIRVAVKSQSQRQLPQELVKARRLKSAGLATSAALLLAALAVAKAEEVPLPTVPSWLVWGAVITGVGGLLLLSEASKQGVHFELHNGRLYIQWGSPSEGAPLAPGSIQVKETDDGRGNGAFAAADIPKGTHIGVYDGEMLNEAAYWERYPSGVSDYCIRIDREWSIDGCARAKDTSRFSPCHMNHSSSRNNVVRSTSRRDKRVSFFAAQDIKAGEELLIDYGPVYWQTRQEQVIGS